MRGINSVLAFGLMSVVLVGVAWYGIRHPLSYWCGEGPACVPELITVAEFKWLLAVITIGVVALFALALIGNEFRMVARSRKRG